MAYILNRAYVLSQLSVLGVTAAELDAAPLDTKIAALLAVANASAAATDQVTLQPQLDLAAQAMKTGVKNDALFDLQIAAYQHAGGVTPTPPA